MALVVAGTGSKKYPIHITAKGLQKTILNSQISAKEKVLIITDDGLPQKYISDLRKGIKNKNIHVFKIKQGEKSKSIKTYKKIIDTMLDLKFSRSDKLIALGGGVVGDITGFCAATFMRGINYIQIPTTLLAQVDSSVGGKTAINTQHGKNLIGAFYNPVLVLISTNYLKTLPESQYKSGLGEVIKYAFIENKKLRTIINQNDKKIINKESTVLKKIIEESIKTKAKIVTKDEKENGIRAILNFGHTFGHAIEAHNKYKNISHGEAITLGMIIAAKISLFEGHIKSHQLDNIVNTIKSLKLNSDYKDYNYEKLSKYLKVDKKVSKGKLNLILINKNFKAFKTSNFNLKNIKKALS